MSGRSFPSPRFSNGSPSRSYQQMNNRQPLYLQPNCPYLSPRGSRVPSPRHSNSFGSPDFIPLGVSSPVGRVRHSWGQRSHSNNSSFSGYSCSPPSSNSSPNFSPYRRNNSRGNFRDRRSFNSNHSGSSSSNISLYVDRDALEDPWAELEKRQKSYQSVPEAVQRKSHETSSTIPVDSEDDSCSSGGDDS